MDRFIDEDEVVSIDVTQDEERLETLKQALDKMSVNQTLEKEVASFPELVKTLQNDSAPLPDKLSALATIRRHARNENTRQKLIDAKVVPALVHCFKDGKAELRRVPTEVEASAIQAFAVLSDTELWLEEMAAAGCVPALMRFIRYVEKGRIRKLAVQALGDIAESYWTRYEINKCLDSEWASEGGLNLFNRVIVNDGFDAAERDAWLEVTRNCELVPSLYKPNGKAFYDPYSGEFPFVKMLEENFEVIREEALKLREDLMVAWPEKYLCEKGWDVLGFFAFKNKLEEPASTCPKTTAILEKIPGLETAVFSRVKPRCHIKPHVGYYVYSEKILRVHMGIMVPKGCTIMVNGIQKEWEEGKVMIFDDTYRHEVWNPSHTQERIVLMFDINHTVADSDRNPDFMEISSRQKAALGDEALVTKDLIDTLSRFGASPDGTGFTQRPEKYI